MATLKETFKAQSSKRKALSVFILLILVSMLAAWYDKSDAPIPSKKYTQAEAIKGTDTPKVDVKIQSGVVKVIPKDKIKKSIKPLPPEVAADNVEVTDTAEVPPSEAGTKIITTIDKITGDTNIYQMTNPVPLLAFESLKRIGAGYGYSTDGATAIVYGDWQFLRVGNVHLGLHGEIEATTLRAPEAKILATAEYKVTK